jgi:hypothetical protein
MKRFSAMPAIISGRFTCNYNPNSLVKHRKRER